MKNFTKEKLILLEALRSMSFIEGMEISCIVPPPTLLIELNRSNYEINFNTYLAVENMLSSLNAIYMYEMLSQAEKADFFPQTKKILEEAFMFLNHYEIIDALRGKYEKVDEYVFYDNENVNYIRKTYINIFSSLKKNNMIFEEDENFPKSKKLSNTSSEKITILYSLVCFADAITDISLRDEIRDETLELMVLVNSYLAEINLEFLPKSIEL